MSKIFAVFLLLIAAAAIYIKLSGPEVEPLQSKYAILAFGDSITYGFGAQPEQSYPAILQRLAGIRVINAGVNGETSEEGMARLPTLLEDDSIRLMILCFGGNDILQQRSMPRLKQNLKRMIAMAKEKGVDVVLVGVPKFGVFGLSSLPLYEEVAKEENVAYMPELLPEVIEDRSLKSDYVHPNAAGYGQMALRIQKKLTELGYTQ